MKEVFRNADSAQVGLFQSLLENAGIQTFVKNSSTQQAIVAGIATAFFPLPQFFPTLYVLNDVDYGEAMSLLKSIQQESSESIEDWQCSKCGQSVPGNFTDCWNCQQPRKS